MTAELRNRNNQLQQEIADWKEKEQEFHSSRTRLAAILEIAGDAIISIDETLSIILFSKKAEKIFGYSAEEMIGKSLELLLPTRIHIVHREHIGAFAQSDIPSRLMGDRQEIFGLRRNGQEFPAEASISKLEIDGQYFFTVIIRDITNQKQIELELQKHQEQLASLVEERTTELSAALLETTQLNEQLQQEIIERKKHEQEFQSQIALVDGLLDAALDTIEIFDPNDMSYLKWNKTFNKFTGYSDEEIAKMDPVADFIDEADIPKTIAAVERVLEKGRGRVRVTQISKDGIRMPLEYTGSVTRDAEGNPLHLIAIGRNITEQLRSEAELQESEKRFKGLFESMPAAVYAWRRSGEDFVLVDINKAADAIAGGMTSNFMGATATNMYSDRPDIVEDMSRCFEEEASIEREMTYQFKSTGVHKMLAVKYVFVPPDLVLVHTEDITQRRQTEKALQASKNLLQSSLDALSANIAIIDEKGIIQAVNDSWRLFADENNLVWDDYGIGRSYVESIDSSPVYLDDDKAEVSKGIQELLSGQSMSFSMEYPCHSPIEQRWFMMRANRFEGDKEPMIVVSHEDITREVEGRQQLKDLAAVTERERLARRLHDAITQSLFSASVISESTPHIMVDDPDLAKRNMEQLTMLLRGTMAEMKTMLIELRPAVLLGKSLGELVRTLVEANRAKINGPITIVVDGENNLPEDVTIVFYRIAQEAISNIIKYAEAEAVRINIISADDHVAMNVKDDGRGFDQQLVPPGYQGLAIMAERMDRIGGELTIESERGNGTEIIARWPAQGKGADHE